MIVDVVRKDVKRLRLVVKTNGSVTCVAPYYCSEERIQSFINDNEEWILKTTDKMQRKREKNPPLQYTTGEKHFLWGKPLTLLLKEERGRPSVTFGENEIVMYCSPDSTIDERKMILYSAYYLQFKPELQIMIEKWQHLMNVPPLDITIRLMRTEWGSCTPKKYRMTFNIDLVRFPKECMEYIVIHEFTHLNYPNHSQAFWTLCDRRLSEACLPDSKTMKKRLAAGPNMLSQNGH